MKQKLNHFEIAQRLPHAGSMCLLNEVIQSDETSLIAQAISHRNIDHPLRIDGTISTINGIEYAAQAMAVHGSLLSEQAQSGYIASVRNINILTPVLPEKEQPLVINVIQLMSNENGFTYQFDISCEQQSLISGKITVFLTHS